MRRTTTTGDRRAPAEQVAAAPILPLVSVVAADEAVDGGKLRIIGLELFRQALLKAVNPTPA